MLLRALRQSRIKLGFVLIAVLSVTVFVAAACGGDDDDNGDVAALTAQIADIQTSLDGLSSEVSEIDDGIQRSLTLSQRIGLAQAEIHLIDEEMQVASEIPAGFLSRIRWMEQILASAPSPAELQDLADELAHNLAAAAAALESENLTESKGAVTTAHASWHAWDGAANTYLTEAEHHDAENHDE